MSRLSANLFTLRSNLLAAAEKEVVTVGFTSQALARAIVTVGRSDDLNDAALASMFDRGFVSALVEHIVKRSNAGTQKVLEAKYNKNAVIDRIAANEENFSLGRLTLPTAQNVAEDAMHAKIAYLHPFMRHWPDAVAVEYQTQNVPYTMIGLAEFVDTAAYHMERVDNLNKLLEPARHILSARMMASYIPGEGSSSTGESASADFLHSFIRGIPLASGPHIGESSFSAEWYTRRAKLAVVYGASITSLMGDASRDALETRSMAKTMVATLF